MGTPTTTNPVTFQLPIGPNLLPPIAVRNLAYHVCPLEKNDGWRWNVRQLLKRIDLFNGKRSIAIAVGDGLESPQKVRELFAGVRCNFYEIPNDPWLREVVSFLPLLVSLQSTKSYEALFYGHTKGNSTTEPVRGARLWTTMMYHLLLDNWSIAIDNLRLYNAVGVHLMCYPPETPPFPSGLRYGGWILAGTFWWVRHDRLFTHPNWRFVPSDRYGAEAYLSGMMPAHAVKSLYQKWSPGDYPTPSPYDPLIYEGENWEQFE